MKRIRRFIQRKDTGKSVVSCYGGGLSVLDHDQPVEIAFREYEALDLSVNGKILLLNSNEWLTRGNANKTRLMAIDLSTMETLFETEKFLAYRAIINSDNSKCLLEYWNGIAELDICTGDLLFRKDKTDYHLGDSDIHYGSDSVYIPSGKKSLKVYNFNNHSLEELRITGTSTPTAVKFDQGQERLLVTDKKNCLHCFRYGEFSVPLWALDFSGYGDDGRVWCFEVFITDSGLACIHGGTPKDNEAAFDAGSLWIFDVVTGKLLERYDHSKIGKGILGVEGDDQIILDDLTTFSLRDHTFGGICLPHSI